VKSHIYLHTVRFPSDSNIRILDHSRAIFKWSFELKLNGIQQRLAYADDVNLLGDNMDTIKKNTKTVIDASKEVSLEINVEKSKYMLLSHHKNVGQNRYIKLADRSFENVSQFEYIWDDSKNQNLI
jgi:hypothetical protein